MDSKEWYVVLNESRVTRSVLKGLFHMVTQRDIHTKCSCNCLSQQERTVRGG